MAQVLFDEFARLRAEDLGHRPPVAREVRLSRFFADFFGLKFVRASAQGFGWQAVRRGAPIHEDLRQKIRALAVVLADETS